MKKAILVFLSVVGAYFTQAQTFTTPSDTVKVLVSSTGGDGHSDITPVGSTPVSITWKVKSIGNLPPTWFSAQNGFGVCDNTKCYYYLNDGSGISDVHTTNPISATDNDSKTFKITYDSNEFPAGGPYYVTATLTDANNSSSTKDVVFAMQKWATSVSGLQQSNDDVTVYPNPARAEINVVFNGTANIKNIAVYNLIGKVVSVYKVTGNNAKLDLSNIPSGIYFMRLVDNSGRVVATRKFTHQ